MARHKNVVTGAFYGSNDYESYITHIDLLLKPQKSGKKDTANDARTKTDNRAHYFTSRPQKLAIDFYSTFLGH